MGGEAFRERLRTVDPARAEKLAPGDKKRLVRAMEVHTLTGATITEHDERSAAAPPRYTALKLALDFTDRERLYRRIDARAAEMFRLGLVEETRRLLARGLSPDGTAMQAIGYREAAAVLGGGMTPAEALESTCRRSRQYAKRQLTWLRRDSAVLWIRWEDAPRITRTLFRSRR